MTIVVGAVNLSTPAQRCSKEVLAYYYFYLSDPSGFVARRSVTALETDVLSPMPVIIMYLSLN